MASRGRRGEGPPTTGESSGATLRSDRIEAALVTALTRGDSAPLLEQLERSSGLPGPRPNVELARAVAERIAAVRGRGDRVLDDLLRGGEFAAVVAAFTLGARSAAGIDARGADAILQQLAEDERRHVRDSVVLTLRARVAKLGDSAVRDMSAWTDGYLQAHAALDALADRDLLAGVRDETEPLARLQEAFALADAAPRAADRSHGLRALRRGMPRQVVALAARWPRTLDWLLEKAASSRPETREVVAEIITALRRESASKAEADRLAAALASSAPPPRDPTRIVTGTRKRSRGRR